MDIDTFLGEIEEELLWREGELRFLNNSLQKLSTDKEKNNFRRSVLLMLYAHFEGFIRFTLLHYISAINREQLSVSTASYSISAAAHTDLFKVLRNPEKKSDYFRSSLPDDTALHRFQRDRDFIQAFDKINSSTLIVPDESVDLESNVKPEVLQKNLFRLGLPYKEIAKLKKNINLLLKFRNSIAHGEFKQGIEEQLFDKCQESVQKAQKHVKQIVVKAYRDKAYLKAYSYY